MEESITTPQPAETIKEPARPPMPPDIAPADDGESTVAAADGGDAMNDGGAAAPPPERRGRPARGSGSGRGRGAAKRAPRTAPAAANTGAAAPTAAERKRASKKLAAIITQQAESVLTHSIGDEWQLADDERDTLNEALGEWLATKSLGEVSPGTALLLVAGSIASRRVTTNSNTQTLIKRCGSWIAAKFRRNKPPAQ